MINIHTIKDLYDKNTPVMQTTQLVLEALELFDSSKSSAIVIIDDNKHPKGILTERDITKHAGHWDEIISLPVGEVMSSPVATVGQEHDFRDAYMQMSENGFRHLVVVKDDGSFAGMLDEGHFLRHLTPEQLLAVKEVKLVMSKNVTTVETTQSVAETIKIMTEAKISSIIIVHDKKPLGILTERDSIRLARQGDSLLKTPITEHMTSPLKTIHEEISVIDAEHMLTHEHIRHLIVVNDKGELSGIVSQHDLVKGISGIYVEMLRDTIRKQSNLLHKTYNQLEEQSVLNNILNSFPDRLIIACDVNSLIKFTNADVYQCLYTIPQIGNKIDESIKFFDSSISDSILKGEVTSTVNAEPIVYDEKREKHYFKTSYAPIFSQKKLLQGFLFTAEDITSEKKSIIEREEQNLLLEEKEQQLLQAQAISKIRNWSMDIATMQADWSTEIREIIGIEANIDVGLEFLSKIVVPADWTTVEHSLMGAIKEGKEHNIEYRIKRPSDDEIRWVNCRAIRILDDNKKPIKLVGTVQDITEKKEKELKIIEQDEIMILQSRQAAMGEMISMIAHQWRQPLSVVAMIINNLLLDMETDTFDEVVAKKDFAEIHDQLKYMSTTIDDFRYFFKPSKEIEKDSVLNILEDIMKIITPALHSNSIKTEIECDSKLMLETYKSELKQVIINILTNAKDVLTHRQIDNRSIKISVKAKNDDIVFSIFNNGPQIDSEHLYKIFEPYFTTKEILGGTGLGLYMSKSIIEKHMHGSIKVININEGVEFIIIVPKILEGTIDK